MTIVKGITLAVLWLCLVPVTSSAEMRNIIRGNLYLSTPTGDPLRIRGGGKLEADNALGMQASYERKFSDLVGINVLLGLVNYDIEVENRGLKIKFAEERVAPLGAAVLFHPIRQRTADWYVGPGVSYVFYDDLDVESRFGGGSAALKNDLAYGVQTGVDIKFGDGTWALNLDLQYLKTHADIDEPGVNAEFHFDSLNIGAGVALRF